MSQYPAEPKKPNWFKTALFFVINSKHEFGVFKLLLLRVAQTGVIGFTMFDDAANAIPVVNFFTFGDNVIWASFIVYALVRIEQMRREVYGYMKNSYNQSKQAFV